MYRGGKYVLKRLQMRDFQLNLCLKEGLYTEIYISVYNRSTFQEKIVEPVVHPIDEGIPSNGAVSTTLSYVEKKFLSSYL